MYQQSYYGYYRRPTNVNFNLIAKMIANKLNIKLKSGNEWKADVSNNIIYYPRKTVMYVSDIAFLIHEAAHLRFTKVDKKLFDDIEKIFGNAKKEKGAIMDLVNSLEDVRIESEIKKVYRGAGEYLDINNQLITEDNLTTLWDWKMFFPDKYKKYYSHKSRQFCVAASEIYLVDKILYDEMMSYVDPKVIKAVKKCRKSIDKAVKAKSTVELLKIIKDEILVYYLPFVKQEDKKKKQKEEECKKQLEDLIEKLVKAFISAAKRYEKNKAGNRGGGGNDIKNDNNDNKNKNNVNDKKGEVGDDEKDNDDKNDDKKEKDNVIKLKRGKRLKTAGEYSQLKPLFINNNNGKCVVDIGRFLFGGSFDGVYLKQDELIKFVNQNLSSVRKAISIFKDLEFSRLESGYESGKLEQRKLHKLFVGGKRIFARKVGQNIDEHDMAVAIVCDQSGSMRGYKSTNACKSVSVFSKALSLAGRKFAVYGFGGKVICHKKFNEKLKLSKLLKIANVNMGSTAEHLAIRKAAEDLKKQPELNKIIIIFCDGGPDDDYELKEEISRAKKFAKIYAFGIEDSSGDLGYVSEFYENFVRLSDAKLLAGELKKIFNINAGRRIRR